MHAWFLTQQEVGIAHTCAFRAHIHNLHTQDGVYDFISHYIQSSRHDKGDLYGSVICDVWYCYWHNNFRFMN